MLNLSSNGLFIWYSINSLPNDKFYTYSKFKAFADNKINVTQKEKFAMVWLENTEGKGENAGYQHFLLFPKCFQELSLSGSLKVGTVL